nr:MAG TPA: hypothetical protein [Caudoviricetes sp.]
MSLLILKSVTPNCHSKLSLQVSLQTYFRLILAQK